MVAWTIQLVTITAEHLTMTEVVTTALVDLEARLVLDWNLNWLQTMTVLTQTYLLV